MTALQQLQEAAFITDPRKSSKGVSVQRQPYRCAFFQELHVEFHEVSYKCENVSKPPVFSAAVKRCLKSHRTYSSSCGDVTGFVSGWSFWSHEQFLETSGENALTTEKHRRT